MMKLFFTGETDVGKSALVDACLAAWPGPVRGFRSGRVPKHGAEAAITLADAAPPHTRHRVARVHNNRPHQPDVAVFDTAGVAMLRPVGAGSPGPVVMDEIGYLESGAPAFQAEIWRVLALDVPVVGALRQRATPFLNQLRAAKHLSLLTVTAANRDSLAIWCRRLFAPGSGAVYAYLAPGGTRRFAVFGPAATGGPLRVEAEQLAAGQPSTPLRMAAGQPAPGPAQSPAWVALPAARGIAAGTLDAAIALGLAAVRE